MKGTVIPAHRSLELRGKLAEAYASARSLGEEPPVKFAAALRALWVWSRIDFAAVTLDQLARVLILLADLADQSRDYYAETVRLDLHEAVTQRALHAWEDVAAARRCLVAAVDEAADEEARRARGPTRAVWHAFECLTCPWPGDGGLVFDVRLPASMPRLETAPCPRCGAPCELDSWWEADEDGYGSRGSPDPRDGS